MMATDLQGGKIAQKGWVLTDPAMLCQDLSRFGPTNFHEAQLQMCYEGAQHALEHGLSLEDCLLGSSYAPGFSRHDDGSRFGAARGRADARARLRREKERKKREKKKKKKPAGDLVAPPETVLRVSQGGRLLVEGGDVGKCGVLVESWTNWHVCYTDKYQHVIRTAALFNKNELEQKKIKNNENI